MVPPFTVQQQWRAFLQCRQRPARPESARDEQPRPRPVPHHPARPGRDPGPGAALHPQVPRQDPGHQVRRQRHDRPGAAARLRRRRGAAEAGGHEPHRRARRRPADRRSPGQGRQEGHLHPGHARHRRRDHGSGGVGAGRPGAAGHRGPDQQRWRQGRGPDGLGRRPHPRAQDDHARQGRPQRCNTTSGRWARSPPSTPAW